MCLWSWSISITHIEESYHFFLKIEKTQLNIIEIGQNNEHVEINWNDECDSPELYNNFLSYF